MVKLNLLEKWIANICPLTVSNSPVASEVSEERRGERGEPEQRRKKSLLAALEQIGSKEEEEEEEEEEEFQVPQQENNSIFSLNKCILGAVLLLVFGTIFFSGEPHSAPLKHCDIIFHSNRSESQWTRCWGLLYLQVSSWTYMRVGLFVSCQCGSVILFIYCTKHVCQCACTYRNFAQDTLKTKFLRF